MRLHVLIPFTLTLLALASAPAVAHHGWSGYDSSKEMTLTGTVREAGYENGAGKRRAALAQYTERAAHAELREEIPQFDAAIGGRTAR